MYCSPLAPRSWRPPPSCRPPQVILQVQTTKPTADEARIAAATATNATLAALQAINGISPTDITTTSISLQPNYVWDQGTQANKLTGYVFTQTLQVTVNNMTAELLGSVVDTAVKTGGNDLQVSSVDTSLSPSQELAVANEARKQAVANALSTASVLAQAAGVTMGPITSIADQTSATTPVPLPMQTGAAEKPVGANVSTPVSVGTQEVQASVGLVLALCSA